MIRIGEWVGALDWFGHALHLPKVVMRPVCNAWDRYLGLTDSEIRRHAPAEES